MTASAMVTSAASDMATMSWLRMYAPKTRAIS